MSKNKGIMHYGFVIVFCCCLITCVNVGLVMSCAGIFYKPVSEELGVSVNKTYDLSDKIVISFGI